MSKVYINVSRDKMIEELHITNLAMFDDIRIDFDSNYVALLGETGAGKSLIVNAINLLKGEKCDSKLFRDKEKKMVVSALFSLSDKFLLLHQELKDFLDESKTVILKRIINTDNSSRYYINDEIVTLNEYKLLIQHLIDIHSQNGKNDLLNDSKQIQYLDLYSDEIVPLKRDFKEKYDEYKSKIKEYDDLLLSHKEDDREYLEFQIANIKKYDLKENEIESLNEEFNSLKDYESIKEKFDQYSNIINSEYFENGISSLSKALKNFKTTSLEENSNKIIEDIYSLQEDIFTFNQKFKELNIDPNRIDYINERLFSLKDLMRRYGKTSKEILDKLIEFESKLNNIDTFEEKKIELENDIEKSKKILLEKAKILSSNRKKIAADLEKNINAQLSSLGLKNGGFKIEIEQKELSFDGIDKVTFLVSMNMGMPYLSLSKTSSGGESSRLMLALKIVLNKVDPYQLVILDEIDTGISGKIASMVAKKIKMLSSDSQVIFISHLPQVVASCEKGILIKKNDDEKMSYSLGKTLTEEQLISFIASMLSGNEITDKAVSNAIELRKEYR